MDEYQREIIEASPIDVFSAGGSGMTYRYDYPYKLESVANASPQTPETCDKYIIDSAIGDDSITNRDVLDKAYELGATHVIPKDYLGNRKKTTESVRDFIETYLFHPCDAEVIIPLQPPHDEHIEDLAGYEYYAIGGIKPLSPKNQIEYLRKFRRENPDVNVHGLGMGANVEFIKEIRENPELVDSVDVSTPEKSMVNGVIPDKSMIQRDFEIPTGEATSTVKAGFVSSLLVMMNYMLSPFCDDELLEGTHEQLRLGMGAASSAAGVD